MTQTGEWPEQPACPMNNSSEMLGGQLALARKQCMTGWGKAMWGFFGSRFEQDW